MKRKFEEKNNDDLDEIADSENAQESILSERELLKKLNYLALKSMDVSTPIILKDDLSNYKEYMTFSYAKLYQLGFSQPQHHCFDMSKTVTFEYFHDTELKTLTLMPAYYRVPIPSNIMCWINVFNVDEVFSDDSISKYIINQKISSEQKRIRVNMDCFQPLSWRKQKIYDVLDINLGAKRFDLFRDKYMRNVRLQKHILVLFAALEIPYMLHLDRDNFQVDHKIPLDQWDNNEFSWNHIINLQYLNISIHSSKTTSQLDASYFKQRSLNKTRSVLAFLKRSMPKEEAIWFQSGTEAGDFFGIHKGSISRACQNWEKRKSMNDVRGTTPFQTVYFQFAPPNITNPEHIDMLERSTTQTQLLDDITGLPIKGYMITDTGVVI